jgi:DNA-binding MarR family transcriptional regulator
LSSVQQWLLLGAIASNPDAPLMSLRGNLSVTKQDITSMVARLKQRNLVDTYPDGEDRRITRIRLTDQGEDVLRRLQVLADNSNDITFGPFSDDEISHLSLLLTRLVSHLESLPENS